MKTNQLSKQWKYVWPIFKFFNWSSFEKSDAHNFFRRILKAVANFKFSTIFVQKL